MKNDRNQSFETVMYAPKEVKIHASSKQLSMPRPLTAGPRVRKERPKSAYSTTETKRILAYSTSNLPSS